MRHRCKKMNIYCDMYEGHDLKMVTGMDSDSLLFDPWPHAFLGTMESDERCRFLDAYRDRIMNSTPENVHSKKSRSGNTSVTCKIIWEL